jgi:predicted dehydrogenase
MQPLRILLVGFGVRGRQWRAALANRIDMDLVGIAEPDPHAATDAGVRDWPSLERALAENPFDAVIIATPLAYHVEEAIRSLEAGLPTLVEKPLAPSLSEAASIAETSMRMGTPALAAQNFRFHGYELVVREVLRAGTIGEPRAVRLTTRRPDRPSRRDRGVDLLWDFTLHHLDLLRSRFGREARVVERAIVEGRRVRIDLILDGDLRVRYGHVEGTRRFRYRERIRGAEGSILLSEAGVRRPWSWHTSRSIVGSREDRLLSELANAIGGAPSAVSVADNLETIALVEAVARSAVDRRPVTPTEIWDASGLTRPSELDHA